MNSCTVSAKMPINPSIRSLPMAVADAKAVVLCWYTSYVNHFTIDIVFSILLYIDRHDCDWAAQVPNRNSGDVLLLLLVDRDQWQGRGSDSPTERQEFCLWRNELKPVLQSQPGIHAANTVFPPSWDFGFARIKSESGTSGTGPMEWV